MGIIIIIIKHDKYVNYAITQRCRVYRLLTQLEQAGLPAPHNFESGKAVFELNYGMHHDAYRPHARRASGGIL